MSLPSCWPGEGLGLRQVGTGTVQTAPGPGGGGCPQRRYPRGALKQHHLYANAVWDSGGASREPGQVRDVPPRRGPRACGLCPRGCQGWAVVGSRAALPHPVQSRPETKSQGRDSAQPRTKPPRLPCSRPAWCPPLELCPSWPTCRHCPQPQSGPGRYGRLCVPWGASRRRRAGRVGGEGQSARPRVRSSPVILLCSPTGQVHRRCCWA